MKPPILNFIPFHPSRVQAIRNWREKDLHEIPKPKRKIKLDGVESTTRTPHKPKLDPLLGLNIPDSMKDLVRSVLKGSK